MYLKSKKSKSQSAVQPVGICIMATCESGCFGNCRLNCSGSCTGSCSYDCAANCAAGPGPMAL